MSFPGKADCPSVVPSRSNVADPRPAGRIVLVVVAAWCCPASAAAAGPDGWMVELTLRGRRIEGTPLAWNARQVHLVDRSGRLWHFPPEAASDYRKTSERFRSYSVSELRAMLLRELGLEFEVSGTSHYLVAHPRGERHKWAGRFEDLYRSFIHYFTVRGFKPAGPPFPLIGIVCRDRDEFSRYAATAMGGASAGVQGLYSPESNRIVLYDMQAKGDSQWRQNASVIIHEATHQTAFNTGIHSRYSPPPLWVAEGLATMFESPGVYDSRSYPHRSDRVNRQRLEAFKELVRPVHRPDLLRSLIASDRLFRRSPGLAYAESWALSFYLVETRPREYAEYLTRTAERPPFSDYTAAERTADFCSVFGDDWRMLEAQFLRFIEQVR